MSALTWPRGHVGTWASQPDGVVAAVGLLRRRGARRRCAARRPVARVAELQDAVTGLLFEVGGFGVVRPGLTVNDSYWELFLPDA